MVTASQMIALRARLATLALFTARQLFEAAMQFFDLPRVATTATAGKSSLSGSPWMFFMPRLKIEC
jgi:hypothetical protein